MNDPNRPGNTEPSFDPSQAPGFQQHQPESVSPTSFSPQAPAMTEKKSAATDPSGAPGWERATLEKLVFASLNEQKTARRWKIFLRLSWLVFFIALGWLVFNRGTPSSAVTSPHTAVIEIRGEIAAGADASAESVIAALRAAFEDKGAKAIVLLINSPGGSPVQAGMMNDEILRLKALYKKPVYAVVEETGASAAYYVAVAADMIYVDKASIIGSIGVLMDGFGFTGLMDKLGIERRLLTAGENKGFLDPFSAQSEKQRAFAQVMLDQIHQQFISVVRAGRGKRLKETPEMFSGLFWSGQQAITLGLADQLGNLDYVAREVVKAEEIVDYTRRENVAERLAKKFGAAMGEGAIKALRAIPSIQ
ncbi:MAG: S49 family peptidase [Polaromonas sp.]